jgi:hypothetical protein
VALVPAEQLGPVRLSQAISAAMEMPHASITVDLSGATNAARLVCDLARPKRHLSG